MTTNPLEDGVTTTDRPLMAANAEMIQRAWNVENAVHSVQMEGLDVTDEWRADAVAVVAGHISADEFVTRTQARYGIHH